MSDDGLDFSEPWAMFADEDEPWKDRERLFRLLDKMDTQAEVGDALGCTPGTVSYWKNKFEEEVSEEVGKEKCSYFEVCGNKTPGGRNELCDCCTDLVRRADREGVRLPDADTAVERMEVLYERYSDYVAEFEQRDEGGEPETPVCDDCDEEMVEAGELDAHICTSCGATA